MRGAIHSINISSGGVPKNLIESAKIRKDGVEGDFNKFVKDEGAIRIELSASFL